MLKITKKVGLYFIRLCGRSNNLQTSCGNVGGGDEAETLELDDDTLLSGNTGYTTLDTLELADGDTNEVAALVVDMLGADHTDIVAVGRQGGDKALHGLIRDDERRIEAVGTYAEVVVVVGDEGTDDRIFQGRSKGLGFGTGKN